MKEFEWEFMSDEMEFETYRMKVPGGWLVRTVENGYHAITSTVTFIPDIIGVV